MSSELLQPLSHKLEALKIKQTARVLLISLAKQTLILHEDDSPAGEFVISTSSRPPSCRENSFGTPTGLHRIAQKIGDGAPLGEVFKGRAAIGKPYWELSEEEQTPNLITSRILWLEGLEPGYNRGDGIDSFDRYIYIHGTNHEDRLGQPASGGCVQLGNEDMIRLFDLVEIGDLVYLFR